MTFAKTLPIFALALFLFGCGDENGFSAAEEEMDSAIYNQDLEKRNCSNGTSDYSDSWCCKYYGYQCQSSSSSQSELAKCYNGTSTHTDSWCCTNYGYRCNSYSSSSSYSYYYSSSSANAKYYTETAKTLNFSRTYYKQLVKFDESSLSDGDPKISFTIKLVNITGDTTKKSTGTLLSLSNQGSWSGTMSVSFAVPANTEQIYVCPTVLDVDVLFDDNYSSGYCYYRSSIGYLDDYEKVYQSDYESKKYSLEWEWYLY